MNGGLGYRLHGGAITVAYDSTNHSVRTLGVTSRYYRAPDGFGVGFRIPLGECHRANGACTYRWRGVRTHGFWGRPVAGIVRLEACANRGGGLTVRGLVDWIWMSKEGTVGKSLRPSAAVRSVDRRVHQVDAGDLLHPHVLPNRSDTSRRERQDIRTRQPRRPQRRPWQRHRSSRGHDLASRSGTRNERSRMRSRSSTGAERLWSHVPLVTASFGHHISSALAGDAVVVAVEDAFTRPPTTPSRPLDLLL